MAKSIENSEIWNKVLDTALQIPGAKIDRNEFLKKEFEKYCNSDTIDNIVKFGVFKAGVELKLLDTIIDEIINNHTGIATSISFATGIPGGMAMLATVPADIAQYYYHMIVVAQKISYIYGFVEFEFKNDDHKSLLTLLIGVMADVEGADDTFEKIFSSEAIKDFTILVIGKTFNKTIMKIAVGLSFRLTGKIVFKTIWKTIPIVGGIVSGGITLATFKPMCIKLKNRLRESVLTLSKDVSTKIKKKNK